MPRNRSVESSASQNDLPGDLAELVRVCEGHLEQWKRRTGYALQRLCYSYLNNSEMDRSTFEPILTEILIGIIDQTKIEWFEELERAAKDGILPDVFREYWLLYIECMGVMAVRVFKELLEIGSRNRGRIGTLSEDWARFQTQQMIRSFRVKAIEWVRDACDRKVFFTTEYVDADESRAPDEAEWRAPKFLDMEPLGEDPYDSATAWERMDSTETADVAEYFGNWLVESLDASVNRAAEVAFLHPENRAPASVLYPVVPQVQERNNGPKRRKPDPRMLKVMRAVFPALQAGHTGLEYCRTVDEYRPPVSQEWLNADWPGSYAKAYGAAPEWKQKIQNQKAKLNWQYQKMSAQQREEIIQGSSRN